MNIDHESIRSSWRATLRHAMLMKKILEAKWWWIAAAVTLALPGGWIRLEGSRQFWLDGEGLILARAVSGPGLDTAFMSLSWFGSLLVLLPVAGVTAFLLWRQSYRNEACFILISLAVASALAHLAKQMVLRPRPSLFPALVLPGSHYSFPSAHAFQVTALALGLLVVLHRIWPRRWRWAAPVLLAIAALVSLSRIYLQVHYPSDVLVGIFASGCWVLGLRVVMFGANAR